MRKPGLFSHPCCCIFDILEVAVKGQVSAESQETHSGEILYEMVSTMPTYFINPSAVWIVSVLAIENDDIKGSDSGSRLTGRPLQRWNP